MNGMMAMCNPPKRISLKELMNGGKKIILEHGDKPYMLSITRKGKLILTAAEQASADSTAVQKSCNEKKHKN